MLPTAVTADTSGALTKVGELRYTPWGSNRDSGYTSGDTRTDYRFTHQHD
jgi:hypothetical protein